MLKKVNSELRPSVISYAFERVRVFHSGEIAQRLAKIFLPQQSADNLATLSFWQFADDAYRPRFEGRAERLDQMRRKLLLEIGRDFDAGFRDNKSYDTFALQLIRNADYGRFGDGGVLDQGILNFGGADLAAGDVHGFI